MKEFAELAQDYLDSGEHAAYAIALGNQAACLLRLDPATPDELNEAIELLTKALAEGRVQQIFRALLYGNRALAHARLQHQREAAADDEKASFAELRRQRKNRSITLS